jgi:peptidoglycan/xylan/chitin deacetylase (PgdA/CDA1 family)
MWPDHIRCAVALTFDLDAESVWLADDPANANRPAVLSHGRYGPRVAVPLILDLLERHAVSTTFFVPGQVAETHGETIRALLDAGHELAVHGYTHTPPAEMASEEDEERHLLRAKAALEHFGVSAVGYRAPAWDVSPHTIHLLNRHGFTYSSNFMDDVRPYHHPDTDIVELPVHWVLDDAPHFWFDRDTWEKKIATPSEVAEIWQAEFEGIYELGGLFVLTLHPQMIGRPHRLHMLEEFVQTVAAYPGVWFATCREIAAHVRSVAS